MEYTPRVLPWQDWAEWTETSKWLFSPDTDSRLRGVGRVKAWRARGRLPVAIDATASLLEVALLESGLNGSRSALELRNLYGMVITRAINGLVEGLQTKFYAEPVNAVAARLGISQWLVDLRHEATHASLPSLATLRMGAQHLLDWLYRGYWEKQAHDLESAAAAATYILVSYKNVALAAQEESPNALCRACRAPKEKGVGNGNGSNGSSGNSSSSSSSSSISGGGGIKTASDARLAEALDGLLASVTPSFVTTFLLPALVRISPEESSSSSSSPETSFFLLPDHHLEAEAAAVAASAVSTKPTTFPTTILHTPPEIKAMHEAKHRQLYAPLLIRLQRKFPGFAHSLFSRLAATGMVQCREGKRVTVGEEEKAARTAESEAAAEEGGVTSPPSPTTSPFPYTYSMWLSYLRSKDWHSHFAYGRSEALFALRRAPGIRFNLRDKAQGSWTSAEREYMCSPACLPVQTQGLGLGPWVGVGEEEVEEEKGEEGEEEGWVRCKEWMPCPLGGPILRLDSKGF